MIGPGEASDPGEAQERLREAGASKDRLRKSSGKIQKCPGEIQKRLGEAQGRLQEAQASPGHGRLIVPAYSPPIAHIEPK